ncbi:MAG: ribonuclease III [Dehalococcoidales bacterium]
MDVLASAQDAIGVVFKDRSLLAEALTHASYTNENPELGPVTNERLEFLGDAILGLVVTAQLFRDFPGEREGRLTEFRARLVRGDTLARVAVGIGLGDHLLLGKGEETTGGRSKPANLAGALEAVIGAVYLDQGQEAAADFILRIIDAELDSVAGGDIPGNYKSELQELLQARHQPVPSYHVVETSGPDHNRNFAVEVRLGDTVLGRGVGRSKQAAEKDAAERILKRLAADSAT